MDDVQPTYAELSALAELVVAGGVAVLTGAGISTASGIPDYRGPETAKRARNPVQFRDFLRSSEARLRYWKRSAAGYPRVAHAAPNRTHHHLVALSKAGKLAGLITQNVDGLHLRAGHEPHVELHGALREVVCLACGEVSARDTVQDRLCALYPELAARAAAPAPDGDADLDSDAGWAMTEVCCTRCNGLLKPHVVFFGENVPRARVDNAMAQLDDARALLVLGSSLTVYSGLRFVRRAKQRDIPVAIVTLGPTRGDPACTLKLDASVGATLEALARMLLPMP